MTEWVCKNTSNDAEDIVIRNKAIPKLIVQILKNRGYNTPEKIERYFAPSLSGLHDPFLLSDMEKAVSRIKKAVNQKEKVLVHGDYDTDGITGSALIIENLKRLGLEVEYYIPHRLTEGYGLSPEGIQYAIDKKCTLVITVDCGITAVKEVLDVMRKGIDIIICDHHKPHESIPDAYAVLNPKLPGEKYPFKELAGIGVAFKLIQGLLISTGQSVEGSYDDLDLVALGSVVDVVPLVDENRILVKYGMKKIRHSKKLGLQVMLKEVGLGGDITAYHLGFIIGPRINACGRLRHAKEALELFLTNEEEEAKKLVQNLSSDNQERRSIEERIYREAKIIIEEKRHDQDRIIIVANQGWHEGVVGIVASSICEDYYRPSILLAVKDNLLKGSARSIPGIDITEGLTACQRYLNKYGGHSQAAGLELEMTELEHLRTCINDFAQKYDESIFARQRSYDMQITLDQLTEDVVYFLKYFEPTGMANPQPVFLSRDLEVVGVPRVIGNDHLKFSLRDGKKVIDAIAFCQADKILNIEVGTTRLDCLFSISEDSFTGKKKTVLKIKEMRESAK